MCQIVSDCVSISCLLKDIPPGKEATVKQAKLGSNVCGPCNYVHRGSFSHDGTKLRTLVTKLDEEEPLRNKFGPDLHTSICSSSIYT
jgi:hypothetical protein